MKIARFLVGTAFPVDLAFGWAFRFHGVDAGDEDLFPAQRGDRRIHGLRQPLAADRLSAARPT